MKHNKNAIIFENNFNGLILRKIQSKIIYSPDTINDTINALQTLCKRLFRHQRTVFKYSNRLPV